MVAREAPIEQTLCPSLIGRQEQLSVLEAGLSGARRGQGRAFVLAGEAGVGKTRLAAEVRRLAGSSGMACLWGSCSQTELSLPYLPILEAVGRYLASADIVEVKQRLGPLVVDLGRLFPQLETASAAESQIDAQGLKLRLYESVVAVLSISNAGRGVLLVVEDLQWGDSATRQLIDYLVRRLDRTSVMVLASYRSDELHRRHPLQPLLEEWRRGAGALILELRPFSTAEVANMLQAIFQVAEVRDEFRDLVNSRSGGNPFVIEELLKAALDRGDIFRTETGWDRKPISELRLPKRVRDAILLRLDQLPDSHTELLRGAAVLGPAFTCDLLAALTGKAESRVQAALVECVQHQILTEASQVEGRYEFRHALTREAIYDDLVASARRPLHKRAADVLAQLPDAHAVEICHHLFAAEEWRAAIPMALKAAEQATAACAYQEAAALYERVLPYLTDVGQRVEVLRLLSVNLDPEGEWARVRRHLEAEIPVIERAGEELAAAKLRLRLARTYRLVGRMDLAQAELERAREVVERQGPSGDLAEVYIRLAHLLMLQFEPQAGIDAARRGLAIAEEVGDGARMIEASHVLAANLWPEAKEECYRYFDRAFELAVAAREFYQAGVALGNCIESLVLDFRLSEAAARLERWHRVPSTSESQLALWWHEGILHACRGELEQAVASYQESVRGYRERGAEGLAAEVELRLAGALADLGRFEECRKILLDCPVPTAQNRPDEAWARMRLDLDSGDLEGALAEAGVTGEFAGWPLQTKRYIADLVVEVLIAVRDTPKAREVMAETTGLGPIDPYQQRMEGRLALVEGEHRLARNSLAAACEFWTQAGARLEEARTRRVLGQVKAQMGDADDAITELRRAFSLAHRSGAITEERRAREQLASLGVATEPTASEVKAALEVLHDPAALAASQLARSANLVGIETGAELRNLLIKWIQELPRGQQASDAEAGNLLLDYYVKRVGSQEVVADRLHLSRRTFYRRLERGLGLLAENFAGYRATC